VRKESDVHRLAIDSKRDADGEILGSVIRAGQSDDGEDDTQMDEPQTQLDAGVVTRTLESAEALATDPFASDAELDGARRELSRLLNYPLSEADEDDVRAAIDAITERQRADRAAQGAAESQLAVSDDDETQPPDAFGADEDEEQLPDGTEQLPFVGDDDEPAIDDEPATDGEPATDDELAIDDVDFPEGSLSQAVRASQSQRAGTESESADTSQIESAYVIRALLARYARLEGGERTVFYLVSWEGFGQSANSWEPRAELERTEALRTYEASSDMLGPDDGLKSVRFKSRDRGYRVSVETPEAGGSDRKRVAVWLKTEQLTAAGRALVDAYNARSGRSGGPEAGAGRRPSGAGRPGGDDSDDDPDDDGGDGDGGDGDGGDGDGGDGDGGDGGGGDGGDGDGDDGDGGDGGDGDPDGNGPADGAPPAPPLSRGKFLQWSANSSEFLVSMTRTIRDGRFDPKSPRLRAAMREYATCRLWLLLCVCPRVLPTDASIRAIAATYYSIEEAAFRSRWKLTAGGPTYATHRGSEIESMVQRAKRRWTRLIAATDTERATLRSYLKALDRIDTEASADDPGARTPDDAADALANGIVAEYRDGQRWYAQMHAPVARTTTQNSLVRYRSAETKRLLGHIRQKWYDWAGRRSDAQRRNDTLGSCFTGDRPTSWSQASVTAADHTVAQSWFENTELISIWSRAREDMNNILPIDVTENSKKGNAPIAYLSLDPDEPAPDHGLFEPTRLQNGGTDVWTEKRQAVSARRVVYTFMSYGLVTEQHDAHSALGEQGAGCAYYAHPRVREHVERIVRDQPADAHERDVNNLLLFAVKFWNPLIEHPDLLDVGEFASHFRKLFKARLAGTTELPWLCNLAIGDAVAGFPGA